ncbi:MAG: hypothetical protein PHQ12_11385, partial [Chthoniobacteraceae bacterium]|nr:hypothetical protein [Chthoniobacteraceae bacterium]
MNGFFPEDCGCEDAVAPLRVLMTADATPGVWTYAMALARALGAGGAEILLAVMGPALSAAQRAEAAALGHVA